MNSPKRLPGTIKLAKDGGARYELNQIAGHRSGREHGPPDPALSGHSLRAIADCRPSASTGMNKATLRGYRPSIAESRNGKQASESEIAAGDSTFERRNSRRRKSMKAVAQILKLKPSGIISIGPDAPVSEIMSREVVCVTPTRTTDERMALMTKRAHAAPSRDRQQPGSGRLVHRRSCQRRHLRTTIHHRPACKLCSPLINARSSLTGNRRNRTHEGLDWLFCPA